MKRLLILVALLAQAQVPPGVYYTVTQTTTLSAAAEVVTVQQPANTSASRVVTFQSAYFDCSVACVVQVERNGSAATTTAGTVNAINPGDPAALATTYHSSNVGSGTILSKYNCPSACSIGIDLTGIRFPQGGGTGTNLTLRTNSITGTVDISIKFLETVIQ